MTATPTAASALHVPKALNLVLLVYVYLQTLSLDVLSMAPLTNALSANLPSHLITTETA